MNNTVPTPKTLLEVVRIYADEQTAFEAAKSWRWPDGHVVCPRCQCDRVHFIETRRVWRCNGCKRQFSVKVGTIFEDSPISFMKWIPAMWLIANCKNGISSYELHRALGVTQKTAWFMLHRIRLAMQDDVSEKIGGHVEADETYVGARARRIPGQNHKRGRGAPNKTIVLGVLERGEKVVTQVIADARRGTLQPLVKSYVEKGSHLYTDSWSGYTGLMSEYEHQIVDHAVEYANGHIHVNGLENFWSLLKRALRGTYVSVEPFHLFRYLDEQSFRYNERRDTDGERFQTVTGGVVGRRLTYRQLTGKELAAGYSD